MLSPKQNALEIIRFGKPEYIMSGIPSHDCSFIGVDHEALDGAAGHDSPPGTRWTDIWGIGWHKELENHMGLTEVYPLADLRKLSSFVPPDPNDPRLCSAIYERAKAADRENKFVAGRHRTFLWHLCAMLMGMENIMTAFYDDPDAVKALARKVMDFHIGIAQHYVNIGVELVSVADDLGSQKGLLFSPRILNDIFVPEYRRFFSFYKRHGVMILFHSCGHIEPLLDFFIDLGVDILNPIQVTANNLDAVRQKTQGKIALVGGVASHVIMDGPAERIEDETRTRLYQLGRDGGYFCEGDQGMPYPKEHVRALHETIERYGRYPIQPYFAR